MQQHIDDTVWQRADIAERFLKGRRAAIPGARLQFEVLIRLLKQINGPIQNILDVGCGDGILADAIREAFPDCHAVLHDFSPAMLEAAQRRFADTADVTYINSSYAEPSWINSVNDHAPFDSIVSGYSIHHQPDERKREVYAELFQLLRPGGIFINIEHVEPSSDFGRGLFEEHYIDNLYALEIKHEGPRSREQLAEELRNNEDSQANILSPIDTQLSWLHDIGYVDVDCTLKIHELAILSGRKPESIK